MQCFMLPHPPAARFPDLWLTPYGSGSFRGRSRSVRPFPFRPPVCSRSARQFPFRPFLPVPSASSRSARPFPFRPFLPVLPARSRSVRPFPFRPFVPVPPARSRFVALYRRSTKQTEQTGTKRNRMNFIFWKGRVLHTCSQLLPFLLQACTAMLYAFRPSR